MTEETTARNARKLALERESLTPLSTDDMTDVVGGTHLCGVTDPCTPGASIDEPCRTSPVAVCLSLTPTCIQTG